METKGGQPIRRGKLTLALANQIRSEIASGTYKHHLPPVKNLMEQFGGSRVTMLNALGVLRQEGLVVTRQGSGTYLADTSEPMRRPGRGRAYAEAAVGKQVSFEDLYLGLRLYTWTQQRVAEINYAESATPGNETRLIGAARRVIALDEVRSIMRQENLNPVLRAVLVSGVYHTFGQEIAEIAGCSTLGHALVANAR